MAALAVRCRHRLGNDGAHCRTRPAEAGNKRQKHLAPGGLWIMSISPNQEVINGVVLHQTVQTKSWWVQKLAQFGFEHREEYVRYFNTQFVRGPKYGAPRSFHLVASADTSKLPALPHESLLRRWHDLWLGSVPQKVLSGTYV